MILIYETDIERVKMNHHVTYLYERLFHSKVIGVHRHTHTTDRLLYTATTVVGKTIGGDKLVQ